jgi:hypothetical protein
MKMLFEFSKLDPSLDRLAVAHYVQVRPVKVDYAFSPKIHDVGIPNVPFWGNRPIKYLRAARHLMHYDGNPPL